MTDEQINIAIAESLGWKVRWQNQGGAPTLENKPAGHCWAVWTNPNRWGLDSNYDPIFPPNYTSDMNAIHEAEALIIKLGHRAIRTYEDLLQKQIANIVFATARQRCEAYLRTIGKWKE